MQATTTEREVPPALAPGRFGRMADEAGGSRGEDERSLEEEDAEAPDQDQADTELDYGVPGGVIDLLA